MCRKRRARDRELFTGEYRVMSAAYPYRAEVIRAMMDADLNWGEVIKPAGELLTLTAEEAVKTMEIRGTAAGANSDSVEDLLGRAGGGLPH